MDDNDRCPATNRDGERCGHPAGWGTENDSGPCKHHGGAGGSTPEDDPGPPEGNQNAADHSMFSDENLYYQKTCDDVGRQLIDKLYAGYYDRYVDRHGMAPPAGDDLLIFKIAVTEHKILTADDWPTLRPDDEDAGHPLLDRSEKRTAQGEPYFETVESAILKAESRLSNMLKKWMKKLELQPGADDADVEVEVTAKMWDDLTGYYNE